MRAMFFSILCLILLTCVNISAQHKLSESEISLALERGSLFKSGNALIKKLALRKRKRRAATIYSTSWDNRLVVTNAFVRVAALAAEARRLRTNVDPNDIEKANHSLLEVVVTISSNAGKIKQCCENFHLVIEIGEKSVQPSILEMIEDSTALVGMVSYPFFGVWVTAVNSERAVTKRGLFEVPTETRKIRVVAIESDGHTWKNELDLSKLP